MPNCVTHFREGPEKYLPGQRDAARSGLRLCTTLVRHVFLCQVCAAGGQVLHPALTSWLAFWAIFMLSAMSKCVWSAERAVVSSCFGATLQREDPHCVYLLLPAALVPLAVPVPGGRGTGTMLAKSCVTSAFQNGLWRKPWLR